MACRHTKIPVATTHAILDITPRAWEEICEKLVDAGYQSQIDMAGEERRIDMHGIALRATEEVPLPEVPVDAHVARILHTGKLFHARLDGRTGQRAVFALIDALEDTIFQRDALLWAIQHHRDSRREGGGDLADRELYALLP